MPCDLRSMSGFIINSLLYLPSGVLRSLARNNFSWGWGRRLGEQGKVLLLPDAQGWPAEAFMFFFY